MCLCVRACSIDGYDADVSFDQFGDSRGRYNIMNYRRNRATKRYEYITVGRWSDGRLYMEAEEQRTDRRITWAGGKIIHRHQSLPAILHVLS